MEKLIIICTVLIIASGAIVGATDMIYTHYQKRLAKIIKEQNELLMKQNEILNINLDVDNQILLKVIKFMEDKLHE